MAGRNLVLVAVGSFVLAVLLPGAVAWIDEVFTQDQVERRVSERGLVAGDEWRARARDAHDAWKRLGDAAESAGTADLADVLERRREAEERWRALNRSDSFLGGRQVSLWLATFLSIGVLVLVVPGLPLHPRPRRRDLLVLGLGLWLFAAWPNLVRALFFPADGRTSFDYTMADVSLPSWIFEHAQWIVFSVLLAVIWRVAWQERLPAAAAPRVAPRSVSAAVDPSAARDLSDAFDLWIVRSLLLAACYVSDLLYYYGKISHEGNPRYVASAISEHVVWAATWVALTLPLYDRWRQWRAARSVALAAIESAPASERETLLALLEAAQPVGTLGLVLAQIAAAATVVFSLVQTIA
jgi:hypothetical protein